MSISIMVLSTVRKMKHSKDYIELCKSTREGIYCNIVFTQDQREGVKERERTEELVQRFFSTMDVYPSNKNHLIREFFGSL